MQIYKAIIKKSMTWQGTDMSYHQAPNYRLSLIITYENKSTYFNKGTLNLKSLKERKLVVT